MKNLTWLLLLFASAAFAQDCHIEDFTGPNISDAKKNFKAICDCNKAGKHVQLLAKIYEVETDATYFTNNPIFIKGLGKNQSKLVFKTKGLPYFDSLRETVTDNGVTGALSGVSMSFENVSLTTSNYEKFKDDHYLDKTKFTDFYLLQNITDPKRIIDVDFIEVKNCFIGGSLQILLGGNHKDYTQTNGNAAPVIEDFHKTRRKYGVDVFTVEDTFFEYPYTFASISAFPKLTNVNRNDIYDLRQALIKVAFADIVNLNDNRVKNDFISKVGYTYDGGYLSLLVASGANKLEGRRNSFVNVLASSGSEVCFVFPSVRNFIWESNVSINSFGTYANPGVEINLIKLKQCENAWIVNNIYKIDREGYYKMGLLPSIDAPIETVSKAYYSSFMSPSSDYNPGFTTTLVGNTLTIPHLNRSTLLMSDNNIIEGNTINVEYVAPIEPPLSASRYNKPDMLWSIEEGKRGYLKHNNNTYNIGKVYNNELSVIGIQKAPFDLIENCGNSYYFTSSTALSFGRATFDKDVAKEGRFSRTYKATGNFINKGSIEDVSGILFDSFEYPYTETATSEYTIGKSIGRADSFIAGLDSFGKSEVTVLQNDSNEFGVFRFLNSDFVGKTLNKYFDNKATLVLIQITAMNTNGLEETYHYRIDVRNRTTLLYSGSKYPVTEKENFKRSVGNLENKQTQLSLVHRNFGSDASYLTFEGLNNYKSFSVSVTVHKN